MSYNPKRVNYDLITFKTNGIIPLVYIMDTIQDLENLKWYQGYNPTKLIEIVLFQS